MARLQKLKLHDLQYTPHVGPVRGVACSPFHHNVFATCGADGALRLYSALQPRPLLMLEPADAGLTTVAWSAVRPAVLAAGTSDGCVAVYDLASSRQRPARVLDVCSDRLPVRGLAFNHAQGRLMAALSPQGAAVYELPARFGQARTREGAVLERLAESSWAAADTD